MRIDITGHVSETDDEKETDGAKNKELKDSDRYQIPSSIRIIQKLKLKKWKIIQEKSPEIKKKLITQMHSCENWLRTNDTKTL